MATVMNTMFSLTVVLKKLLSGGKISVPGVLLTLPLHREPWTILIGWLL